MKRNTEWYQTVDLSSLNWLDKGVGLRGKLSPELGNLLLAIGMRSRQRPMVLSDVYAKVDKPDVVSGSPEAGMVVYFYAFSPDSAELDHAIVFHVANGKIVDFGTNDRTARMIDLPGNDGTPDGLLTLEQYGESFVGSAFDTEGD